MELDLKLGLEILKLGIVTLALFILYRYRALFETSLSRSLLRKGTYVTLLLWLGFLADVMNDVYPTSLTKILDDIIISFALLLGTYYLVDYMRRARVAVEPSKIVNGTSQLKNGAYLAGTRDIDSILRLSAGKKVMALTRTPEVFKKRGIPYLWLSKVEGENSIDPLRLPAILHRLISMADEDTVIIIDGLEYLIMENGFSSVFKFLTTLRDYFLLKGGTLVAVVSPAALEESQLSLLRREFKELDVE
ncbi:DUF835 domain-containing protein [Thermococcus waiotapuensis]|uniref:DUF835 domain-containing protein n=1 Tax=Thermococcus waiotapuensis TaxID=90909 RepID=A0AAE4NXQ2_9EURY|nr:DUF835 domain-containing protein [Thermococcus waiotapuensis]MDV3104627.1 DUF835 domain-containing protein [Thermococcus waiotapuensis]